MSTTGAAEKRPGLDDVASSLRALARSTCTVAVAAVDLAESQLGMAISISEQLRDSVISPETLEQARAESLPAKLRQDAHRVVDLIVDLNAVAFVTAIRFVEGFVKEPR